MADNEIFDEIQPFGSSTVDFDFPAQNYSVRGTKNNFIATHPKLTNILNYALRNKISDIYLYPGSYVKYKSSLVGMITANEMVMDKIGFNSMVTESEFQEIIKSIFPNEGDMSMYKANVQKKEPFDFSASYLFNGENYRIRIILVESVKGTKIVIRCFPAKIPFPEAVVNYTWALDLVKSIPVARKFFEQLCGIGEIKEKEKGGLRDYIKRDFSHSSGLIVFCGPTGSGKSTGIASFLQDRLNSKVNPPSVITVEDPIEVYFDDGYGDITQFEVGTHISSFSKAIWAGKRQNPNIVYISEIRDGQSALALKELLGTGVLAIITIHASTVSEAIEKVCRLIVSAGGDLEDARQTVANQLISVINTRIIPVEILDSETGRKIPRSFPVQEYCHIRGAERGAISNWSPSEIESSLIHSPPQVSITKMLFLLYLAKAISLETLLLNVTNKSVLPNLISDAELSSAFEEIPEAERGEIKIFSGQKIK